jgi:hemin uptake protein HemP
MMKVKSQPVEATSSHAVMVFGPTSLEVPKPLQSAKLFNGSRSILIEHNGSVYQLQTTRQGKLILTK